VLLGLSILTFAITRLIGGLVRLAAGPRASEAQVQALREKYGYDRLLIEQYLSYIGGVLQGDLGDSVLRRRPVGPDLAVFFPATLELVLASLLIAVVAGVPLGLISAVFRDRWRSGLRGSLVWAGSLPTFWLAIILQLTTILGRMDSIPGVTTASARRRLHHRIVCGGFVADIEFRCAGYGTELSDAAALCLLLGALATVARTVRADTLEVMATDHIRTARAIGVPELAIVLKYALKNSSLNTLTQVGLFFGYTLTGSVLVESIFSWPGIGGYAVDAALSKDFVPLMGVTLLTGLVIVIVNLLTDLLYGVLDPRIRYA
jgi:peptide/nickel transport system permease protein